MATDAATSLRAFSGPKIKLAMRAFTAVMLLRPLKEQTARKLDTATYTPLFKVFLHTQQAPVHRCIYVGGAGVHQDGCVSIYSRVLKT